MVNNQSPLWVGAGSLKRTPWQDARLWDEFSVMSIVHYLPAPPDGPRMAVSSAHHQGCHQTESNRSNSFA